MKRISLLGVFASIAAVFIVTLSVQGGMAAHVNWQDAQQARFEETGLKPGETIEKGDWNKVEKLLPSSIVEWLREGYLGDIKIGEFKYDPAADEKWMNTHPKNSGKYTLDGKGALVEVATGEPPLSIYGFPFPHVDLRNDPLGAMKYMYNRFVNESRKRSFKVPFISEWISKNGFDRSIESFWIEYRYWSKSEDGGQVRNPGKHQYREITPVTKPYDLAGTVQMTVRKLDGTEDDVYVYVPAIRRVKKMSGANRSDPYMGSDACADDKFGWAGRINSMKWRVFDERIGLVCITKWAAEQTVKTTRLSNGTWITPANETGVKVGWQVKGWKGAAWAPVNVVWVPRTFLLIEGIPKDRYYNYGRFVCWFDKETYVMNYKVIWDKAGEYWKTLVVPPAWVEFAEKKRVPHGEAHLIFDKKTNHASVYHHSGNVLGRQYLAEFNNPDINPKLFTVEKLRMWSK